MRRFAPLSVASSIALNFQGIVQESIWWVVVGRPFKKVIFHRWLNMTFLKAA